MLLWRVVPALLAVLAVCSVLLCLQRHAAVPVGKNTFRYPRVFCTGSAVLCGLLLALLLFFLFTGKAIALLFVAASLLAGGIYLFAGSTEIITFDDEGLTRQLLWFRRSYPFAAVRGVVVEQDLLEVWLPGRRIHINRYMAGSRPGLKDAIWRWHKSNQPAKLKTLRKTGYLLGGNMKNAENVVFVWGMFFWLYLCGAVSLLESALTDGFYPHQTVLLWALAVAAILTLAGGLAYGYFIKHAARFPRMACFLAGRENLRNPAARKKLGLRPIE